MPRPASPRPFLITDAAINLAPTVQVKADSGRNAADLVRALGIAWPRAAC